jgi:hypothetical protein
MVRGGTARTALALGAASLALAACGTLKGKPPAPAAPVAETPTTPAAPAAPLIRPPLPPAPPAAPAKASCVPRALPRSPKYPDSDQALRDAGGAADRYQLMAAGRLLRIQRLAELERVIEGCR